MVWHKGHGFFVIQQHSALTCFSVQGLFFRLKCNALWPPFSPPCFPLLVARKVSYCPSMYDDGLVAVNACEHSVISSNMASSVQKQNIYLPGTLFKSTTHTLILLAWVQVLALQDCTSSWTLERQPNVQVYWKYCSTEQNNFGPIFR